MSELGLDTEGMVDSTAKLREEILALSGVDIMLNEDTFKSPFKIMDELAAKWKDLTDIQQASITELIAGKRQGNIVSSLMNNFDVARQALEVSANSAGSAMREHEKASQSLEFRLNKLKSTWQSLSQSFMGSDFLKSVLDGVIALANGLNNLIDTFGTLPTLIGAFAGGLSALKNKGLFTFDKDVKSIKLLGTGLTDLKSKYSQVQTAIDRYNSLSSKSASFQEKYNKHLANSSTSMGKYLKGLNGAKASFGGYIGSLIGATVKTVALEAATIALNAALTMGISALISFGIKVLDSMIVTADELAEKVEEVTSKYKEQHSELKKLKGDYDTSNEDSMISKYEKLSKGVDSLGRNVSLTSDEYSEYQSIVNKIAEQIPSLVSGYDSQGNALLSCKGNVEELTAAYEKLIHAQNQDILSNAGDIEKNFDNIYKDKKSSRWDFWELSSGTVKDLEKIYNGESSLDEISKLLGTDGGENQKWQIAKALEKAGTDVSWMGYSWSSNEVDKLLEETMKTNPSQIKGIIDDWYTQFAEVVEQKKSIATSKLSEAFDVSNAISGLNYGNIGEELQQIAYQTVNSLDFEFFADLKEKGQTVEQWITGVLDKLNGLSKFHSQKIESAFDLQTQFNGGEISYGDYVKGLQDVNETIEGLKLDSKVEEQLKISLGLDEDGIVDQYEALVARLSDNTKYDFDPKIMPSDAKAFLDNLSANELSVAVDVITEMSENDVEETIADIEAAIRREMAIRGLTFDLNLEVETAGIDAVNTALAESVSATGLSSESIEALKGRYAELESEGYNLSNMFEETSQGIHLNKKEFNDLERAYSTKKLADVESDLTEMKRVYDELGEAIRNCDDPIKKSELYNDRLSLSQKISEAATLATQYKGLASAYNAWLSAEEAGSERDMYEKIVEGFETVGDEIKRGWADDGTIKFLELLTGKTDLASKSGKELKEIYDSLDKTITYKDKNGKVLENTGYSISDFFTVDKDGNSTSKGVYNFLDAIGRLEEEAFGGKDIVKRDKNQNIIGFDFELAGGDEAIAEALGVSEELVQIMVRAADDAGFVVSLDGTYKQLAELQNEATAAANYLKEIGKTEFEFDFNTTDVTNLKTQLEEAHKILDDKKFWNKDGTFNFDAKGATEAMTVVSTLQAKLDNLTKEQYGIGLTVEDEEFEEPLEKLQEYGRNIATLNQLKLNPNANAEEIKKINEQLEETSKYFANLDEETKVKLGFEADDNWKEVKGKIESGEVTIPTALDIQVNMDKNLETLADLALLKSGLLSEEEEETIKKKYKINLDGDVDSSNIDEKIEDEIIDENDKTIEIDKRFEIKPSVGSEKPTEILDKLLKDYDDHEIEVITKFLADPSEVENYNIKDKEAVIRFIADTMEVDGYTPEEKKAYARYLVDGGNIDSYTPEQKQAIVEYLTDSGDPDNWTPEQKEAVAKFKKDSAEVDNYSPEDRQAIAKFIKNSIEPDRYVPSNKEATVKYWKDSKIPDGYQPANKTATVTFWAQVKKKASDLWSKITGTGGVDGTAHVDGTAFANGTVSTSGRAFKQGDWGTKDSGIALGGEEAPELLVRNGRWHLIGEKGAEFFGYKKGDIIFNASQTKEIFEKGKITHGNGRGKALVSGTAFDGGSTGSGGGLTPSVPSTTAKKKKKTTTTKNTNKNSVTGKDYNKSKDSSSTNDFEETFDWIEVKIARLERAIDRLDKKASGTWRSWTSRNKALTSEISKVRSEINLQEKAYDKYMAAANATGLSSKWKKKVRDGSLDFSTVKDEKLAEKIKDYQTYYEAALQCKDTILELKDAEAELYKQKFENVQARFDGILQGYEHTETMLNEYIAQAEAQGHIVSTKYYDELIKNEKAGIKQLQKEQAELVAKRDEWLAAGGSKDSQDWRDMCADIDAVTQAIEKGRTSLLEYNKAIRDIEFETFELAQERLSNLTDEADFFVELMSNKKLHDDNGQLTNEGKATMGMYAQNHNVYMRQADDYGAKAQNILDRMALDPSDENYLDPLDQTNVDKYYEYLGLQRESILNAEKQKNAIKDLVEEGINLELEALQERIDKQNESLQSAKDLYDYNKKVKDQTKEIASLEKQMSAYQGDDSEESQMKIQEIKVALEEAKENLQETEYDKYISDQSALLDNLYNEYETILNSRLDNIDGLISDTIASINENAGTIAETIYGASDSVGYNMSESMKTIWGEAYKQVQADSATRVSQLTGAVNSLITNGLITKEQGNSLITSLGDGSTGSATATLNRIKEMLANGEIGQADANELIASLSLGDQEQVKASLNSMNDWVADKKMSQQDADAITKAFVTGNVDDIKNANNLLNSLVKNGTLTADDVKGITNALKGSQVKGDNVATEYGKDFGKKDTKVNDAVDEVKKKVNDAVKASDKEAKTNIKKNSTSTSAKKDPTKDNKKSTTKPKPTTTTTKNTNKGDGEAEVGDKVKFVSGEYYYSSDGLKPKGTKNLGKDVYITKINTKSWATHPYHISTGKKLGSGDLGWLKLKQLRGYVSGKKKISDSELAWTQEGRKQEYIVRPSDGAILTPVAKGDSVLNATASGNIWSMANNPAEFIKNNLGLDNANVPNAANVNNTYTQHLENVTFSFPNVHSYDEMLSQMQKDKNFERLILSMSIDRVVGKSALAKGKAIR